MFVFGLFLGASVLRDLMDASDEAYGAEEDEYGVMTGAGGIRGMPTFQSFTPDQIAAYNRDGAAQGLRGGSVAPVG